MVLESKWADAPDEPEPTKPKATKKKEPHPAPVHNNLKKDKKKKYHYEKDKRSAGRPRSQPETIRAQKKNDDQSRPQTHPQTRLVFSTNDTDLKDVKVEKIEPRQESGKLDLLKQRIEEQRRILEQKKHKKQQEELLQSFLNGKDKLDWDEDEEDQILEKLNYGLKI